MISMHYLRKYLYPVLHSFRFILEKIAEHTFPRKKNQIRNHKCAYQIYYDHQMKMCAAKFHDLFKTSINFDNLDDMRTHSIKSAIEYSKNTENLFLEFGVYKGHSANFISKLIKDYNLYAFDSFNGLKDDWKGGFFGKYFFDLEGKIPKLNNNIVVIKGWIEDTLDDFIIKNLKNSNKKISFIHIDTDTYETSNFILKNLKPFLAKNCIIMFDEIYNFPGWENGEYKSLIENFGEQEYRFINFNTDTTKTFNAKEASIIVY